MIPQPALVNVLELQRLAIAVAMVEAVCADPFVVADDGVAAGVVAIGRDVDGCGTAAEAESDEDLSLGPGWGREQERACGNSGDE